MQSDCDCKILIVVALINIFLIGLVAVEFYFHCRDRYLPIMFLLQRRLCLILRYVCGNYV